MKKKSGILVGVVAGVLLAAHGSVRAQTATVVGSLGNFDVANNQQQEAHGFEIEFEGIQPQHISSTFEAERYGAPVVIPTPTGVIVRWASQYDPATGSFTATTAGHDPDAPLAGACYQWAGPAYDGSGCEHFGVTLQATATAATYRWLVADPRNPGALAAGPVPIVVATPAYWVTPPTNGAPVLNADIDAPQATDRPTSYGDAFWLKIFRRPLTREVDLGELTSDNPAVVPEDASSQEVSWVLIQADPLIQFSGGNQKQSRGRTRNSNSLSGDTGAVVRRYEMYEYSGLYDPYFHEAVCADLSCSVPSAGELGALISAQMTAANLVVPSVSITKSGNGTVTAKDGRINCGSACSALYPAGASLTLVASTSGGNKFTGWTGACSGISQTCTVLVDAHLNIGATFTGSTTTTATTSGTTSTTTATTSTTKTSLVTLSIGLSNKGSVLSDDGAINCPSGTCSAKFPVGATVTLTAVPTVAAFQSWTDACTGTGSTCTFTITRDAKVQATFNK
jgi:Divergent InlB B-repeat domain